MASFDSNSSMNSSLTDEASKIRFDRQIRVWGAEAQARIQSSHVLICGLRGLHPEVVKNIVLAGVSVTIQDDRNVTPNDLAFNFFLSKDNIGSNIAKSALSRIKNLNNFATVKEETTSLSELSDEYFKQFPVIVICNDNDEKQIIRINNICHQNNSIFFSSIVFGEEGCFFQDFGTNFNYKDDPPNNKDIKNITNHSYEYMINKKWSDMIARLSPLNSTFIKSRIIIDFLQKYGKLPEQNDYELINNMTINLLNDNNIQDENFIFSLNLQKLCNNCYGSPIMICSVLGSFLGQQVIKAVSLSGDPGNQIHVFSGDDYICKSIPLL